MDKAKKQKILKELGGISENVYDELVNEIILQIKGQIPELKGLLNRNDFDSMAKIAHSIKGSSGNLRFTKMQEAAKALEFAVKEKKDKRIFLGCIAKMEEALEDIKRCAY